MWSVSIIISRTRHSPLDVHYELCERYPEERLEELRNSISGGTRFWVERGYGESMIRTADEKRIRHLEQKLANDGHLAELSRQARLNMIEPSRG